jgi:MoaA/NifB/PqqE/SkfB family radical SAM enzyme
VKERLSLRQFDPQGKILWHLDRVVPLLDGQTVYPIMVELDPSNLCNQKCIWCTFDYARTPDRMEWDMMKTLLRELSEVGVKSINWTGGGEPMTNEHTSSGLVLSHALGMQNGLYSNGMALQDNDLKVIAEYCTWFRLSLDAAERDTYSKLHDVRPGIFDKVVEDLKKLVKLKKSLKSNITLGSGMLVHPLNYKEIYSAAKMCKDIGIDYFQIKPVVQNVFSNKQYEREWWDNKVWPEMVKANELSDDKFHVLVTTYKFYDVADPERDYGREYKKCLSTLLIATIMGDGKVYLCCHLRGFEKYCLGNLHDKTFKEIWDDPKHKEVIESINFNDCQPLCKNHEVNKMLWHLSNPDPNKHPNFL